MREVFSIRELGIHEAYSFTRFVNGLHTYLPLQAVTGKPKYLPNLVSKTRIMESMTEQGHNGASCKCMYTHETFDGHYNVCVHPYTLVTLMFISLSVLY